MFRPETLRKTLIIIGLALGVAIEAFLMGHSVSMIAALYTEKDDINITDETISWIISIFFVPMVFGILTATVITEKIGRRLTITAFTVPVVAYWIIIYYARNDSAFIIAKLMSGFCFGGIMPTISMATAEYSSPKMRGSCLALIVAMSAPASIIGQSLSLVFHWRTTALIAIVPTVLAATAPLFYVESPHWLASKGQFEKCRIAFIALHGSKTKSEKELQLLIKVEKSKFSKADTQTAVVVQLFRRLKAAGARRYFWKVISLGYVIQLYKIFCGTMLKGLLGVTILQKITGHSNVLLFTFVTDGSQLLGCVLSSIFMSKFKTNFLLYGSGAINGVILFVFSLLLYIDSYNNTVLFPWVNVSILSLYYFFLSATTYPILETIPQELFPLEIKTLCLTIISFFSTMTLFVYIKTVPELFIKINYYGVYMINVVITSICLFIFWLKLPDTRGKTLQEIELSVKNDKLINIDDVLETEQIKQLV